MNVLYVLNTSHLTGASKSLINLIINIREKGVEECVILPEDGALSKELLNLNIRYKIIPFWSWLIPLRKKDSKLNFLKYYSKTLLNRSAINKIKNFIKENNVDIVHINNLTSYVGAVAGYEAKVKVVWHFREFLEEDHQMTFLNKTKAISLLERADSCVAISKSVQKKFNSLMPNKKIDLVYNGVPILDYKIDKKEYFNTGTINLLLAGRITRGKGHIEALKALEYLIEKHNENYLKLLIVGSGSDEAYNNELRELVNKSKVLNSDNVQFIEFTNDLYKIREESDIALVCSAAEAFGRVTIESMISSLLVIGANSAGTKELISDKKTGLLYRQGDYIDLANKILYAIENKKDMEKIIINGKDYALKNFSINNTINGMYEIYKKLNYIRG